MRPLSIACHGSTSLDLAALSCRADAVRKGARGETAHLAVRTCGPLCPDGMYLHGLLKLAELLIRLPLPAHPWCFRDVQSKLTPVVPEGLAQVRHRLLSLLIHRVH